MQLFLWLWAIIGWTSLIFIRFEEPITWEPMEDITMFPGEPSCRDSMLRSCCDFNIFHSRLCSIAFLKLCRNIVFYLNFKHRMFKCIFLIIPQNDKSLYWCNLRLFIFLKFQRLDESSKEHLSLFTCLSFHREIHDFSTDLLYVWNVILCNFQ